MFDYAFHFFKCSQSEFEIAGMRTLPTPFQFPSILERNNASIRFSERIMGFLFKRKPHNTPKYFTRNVPIYCYGPSFQMRAFLHDQVTPLSASQIHQQAFPSIPSYYVSHYFIPFLKKHEYIYEIIQTPVWVDKHCRPIRKAPLPPPLYKINKERAIALFHREKITEAQKAPAPSESIGFHDVPQPTLEQVLIPGLDTASPEKVWDDPNNLPSYLPPKLDPTQILVPKHPRDYVFLDPRTNRWNYIPFSTATVRRRLERKELKEKNKLMNRIATYLNRKERRCDEHLAKLSGMTSAEKNIHKRFVAKTHELLQRREERRANMKTVLRERLPGIPRAPVILKKPNVNIYD